MTAAREHTTFPNWKISTSHHFFLFTQITLLRGILSFSACKEKWVWSCRAASLMASHSRMPFKTAPGKLQVRI